MMVLTGRAASPSVLVIEDEKITIRPAGNLWGMGSLSSETRLKEEMGEDFQILTIGPAGENRVAFACITHDFGRQAGRVGIGAVLGSKNIKAIAVKGTGSIPVNDPRALLEEGKRAYRHHRLGHPGGCPADA
jgi:aldehyde:ferredoxin oxidoreductase